MYSMINSSSLFHFTREFEVFRQILTEGLRFSYCYEPFGDIVAKQGWDVELKKGTKVLDCEGIAIPMISFCDIPLFRTQKHRERFGNYMIGFNREALINVINSSKSNYILNPVQYRCHKMFDEQLLELSVKKNDYINQIIYGEIPNNGIELTPKNIRGDLKFKNLIMRTDIREKYSDLIKDINSIDSIIGFSKPYKDKCGYDYMSEREWRIIIPDCNRPAPDLGWLKYSSEEMFDYYMKKLKDDYPSELYLHLYCVNITSLITHLIVANETERTILVQFIINKENNVLGCELSDDQRMNLISKITSFEQIERDY